MVRKLHKDVLWEENVGTMALKIHQTCTSKDTYINLGFVSSFQDPQLQLSSAATATSAAAATMPGMLATSITNDVAKVINHNVKSFIIIGTNWNKKVNYNCTQLLRKYPKR